VLSNEEDDTTYSNGDGAKCGDGIGAAVGGIRVYVRFLMGIVVIVMAHEVFSRGN